MHGFLKHEFLKSKNRFIALTLFLTALLSCYFLYIGWTLSKIDFAATQRVTYSEKATQLENDIDQYLQNNAVTSENGKEIAANLNAQKKLLQDMIDSNNRGDWKSELSDAVKQLTLEEALTSTGVLHYNQDLSQTMARDEYFLSHSIRPKNSALSCDGLNVVVIIFQKFLPIILLVCSLLLSLGAWLPEASNGTIKLLLWQARAKRKILFDKFLIAWIESIVSIFISCLMVFIICWLLFGLGEMQYPIWGNNNQVATTGSIILHAIGFIPVATLILTAVCSLTTGIIILSSNSN